MTLLVHTVRVLRDYLRDEMLCEGMLRAFLVQLSATLFVIHSHRGAAAGTKKNKIYFYPLEKTPPITCRRETNNAGNQELVLFFSCYYSNPFGTRRHAYALKGNTGPIQVTIAADSTARSEHAAAARVGHTSVPSTT